MNRTMDCPARRSRHQVVEALKRWSVEALERQKSSQLAGISPWSGTDYRHSFFAIRDIREIRGDKCLSAVPPKGGTTNNGWPIAMLIALIAVFVVGCKSIGPGTVERDRADYSSSVSES